MARTRTRLAPVHPGEVLDWEFLKPLGLSAADLAARIGMPLEQIEGVLRRERSLDAALALRLGTLFGTTPEFWVHLQGYYDLERARDHPPR
ncbi:MAG TPA: HigA family addiction module antitoxin [Oscillatoriaceae cyanobacterium]